MRGHGVWLFCGFLSMAVGCGIIFFCDATIATVSAAIALFFIALALIVYGAVSSEGEGDLKSDERNARR